MADAHYPEVELLVEGSVDRPVRVSGVKVDGVPWPVVSVSIESTNDRLGPTVSLQVRPGKLSITEVVGG